MTNDNGDKWGMGPESEFLLDDEPFEKPSELSVEQRIRTGGSWSLIANVVKAFGTLVINIVAATFSQL